MNVFSQKKSFKIKNNLLCMQVFLSKRIVKQFSSMHSSLWLKLYTCTCISAWSSRLQVTCNRTYLLAQYARWINFPVHIRLDTKLHNNQYITCIYVSTCSYKLHGDQQHQIILALWNLIFMWLMNNFILFSSEMKNFKKFGMKPSVWTSKKLACCSDITETVERESHSLP